MCNVATWSLIDWSGLYNLKLSFSVSISIIDEGSKKLCGAPIQNQVIASF
jgi:hypothetical protein